MDANRAVEFVPAEGIEQVLLAPIPPERKIAIMLAAIGHDVKLEGLEGVVADSIKAQISRFNARYDLAVQKRRERQQRYRDAKRAEESDGDATLREATPEDVALRSVMVNYPPQPKPNRTETKPNRNQTESPQSPPTGGVALPSGDPVPSSQGVPKKNEAAPPAQPEGKRGRAFRAPTAEEVAAYAASRGASLDAERFVDFYASKGWRVGRAPMRDWQAAVRNWLRNRGDGAPQKNGAAPPAQPDDPLALPQRETAAEQAERWARDAAEARAAAPAGDAAPEGGPA